MPIPLRLERRHSIPYVSSHSAAIRFPAVYTTVRDLVRRMAFPAPTSWPPVHVAFEERVWQTVRRIVSDQAGVAPEEVRPETNFIIDLNLD